MQAQVIVAWIPKGSTNISTLGYNGGSGPVRVYPKDKIDPRAYAGRDMLPYYRSATEAYAHMIANPGIDGSIQLDTRAARMLGIDVGIEVP